MASYRTGDTIYDHIVSLDSSNNAVTGATFDNALYRNGTLYTAATLSFSIVDSTRAVYQASFSASTTGEYQIYSDNQTTNTIYVSEIFRVQDAEDISTSIYLGF